MTPGALLYQGHWKPDHLGRTCTNKVDIGVAASLTPKRRGHNPFLVPVRVWALLAFYFQEEEST